MRHLHQSLPLLTPSLIDPAFTKHPPLFGVILTRIQDDFVIFSKSTK